ncbi:MAG TPA: CvpA family protein [Hellea balneolensis]|uniref:CvpA family protein n=1 Tax=Hellea balneolensis TaxID=287478 RepID=A0A7C5LVB6_9PROT|nr:CvpA family protein [Hellea balneolensis]
MEVAGTSFGGFDVVVFIILGFSGILSFARGFSREFISIVALLVGLAGALFLFGRYQIDVQTFIKPDWLANAALLIAVFMALYLIVSFVMRRWAKTLTGAKPGFLDRLLGLGFGLARGALLASLFVLVISKSAKNGEPAEWMSSATTYPVLRSIADKLEALPFAKAREIVEDIKKTGEDSDILPDIPNENDR